MRLITLSADPEVRLRVYLNDHLAGATAGTRLARRCAKANEGEPLGEAVSRLAGEIEADRATLLEIFDALKLPRARPKEIGAGAAELLGRLKPNGQLIGASPLSRLVELEGLCAGVDAKGNLWISLHHIKDTRPGLSAFDFEALAERAARQRDELEGLRRHSATDALAGSGPAVPREPT
ncbi:hypothetical protein ER308_01460 [Egibacter rhizosphaerae]|uniref:Uncharacterized protein n=1 Tax=Egibacter rhizosphaerae TaxID=1670831 RepID=A0A411YB18_9ACTN|nr:hypothetical protein [Egibacter rhizosphaerae]QBI18368.1 hypothetical protein ER308_01460 [Egibacter rhizosphaerae]